jgi:hypothetical protein
MKNKRGLSQVVTTLIILVVSILLAAMVAYYATNVTMTRTATEDVVLEYTHVWVATNGTAEAALYLKNVGGRDIVIEKLTIRGVACTWDTVWYNNTPVTKDLSYESAIAGMTQATDHIPVESSGVRVIYITTPDNVELRDVGTSLPITVFTVDGQWIKEVLVEYSVTS